MDYGEVMSLDDAALRERKDIARVLYDEWDCVHTETMRREYNEDGHEDFANLAPAELAQWLAVADKAIALRDAARAEQRETIQGLMNACDELMIEFVSKKRAANWGVINDAMVAGAAAIQSRR